MTRIKLGDCYTFSKSGNKVKVLSISFVNLNGKKVSGHTVKRIDSEKTFFAPKGTLISL